MTETPLTNLSTEITRPLAIPIVVEFGGKSANTLTGENLAGYRTEITKQLEPYQEVLELFANLNTQARLDWLQQQLKQNTSTESADLDLEKIDVAITKKVDNLVSKLTINDSKFNEILRAYWYVYIVGKDYLTEDLTFFKRNQDTV